MSGAQRRALEAQAEAWNREMDGILCASPVGVPDGVRLAPAAYVFHDSDGSPHLSVVWEVLVECGPLTYAFSVDPATVLASESVRGLCDDGHALIVGGIEYETERRRPDSEGDLNAPILVRRAAEAALDVLKTALRS